MKRFRLIRLMAAVGALMLVLIASSSYAEQYEAISTDSRSLKYTNTFGLFSNDYDSLVNPRLLSRLEGQRVITNLTNLDDADEFQLGYGGKLVGPGNIAGVLSLGTQARDSVVSDTDVDFDDLDGDGIDDAKEVETYTIRNPYSLRIQNNLDGYLGYGYLLQADTGVGIGLGYNRNSLETSYWEPTDPRRGDMYIRGNVPGIPGFPGFTSWSTFLERTIVTTDLVTGNVIETETTKMDGTFKESGNEIDVLLGADRKFGPKLTVSADVIVGLGSKKDEGEGTYTYRDEMPGSVTNQVSLTSSINETLNSMRRYGIAVEGQYSIDPKHLLHLELGYEGSPGKIKESESSYVYSSQSANIVTGLRDDVTQTYRGERSGNTNKGTLLVVSLRDNYTVTNILSLGFGGEFNMRKVTSDYTDSGTYNYTRIYENNGIPGEAADFIRTEIADMSRDISAETSTIIFAFPISAVMKVTKKLEFRLGARYAHIITKSEFSDNLSSYQGITWREVRGNGQIDEGRTPPANAILDNTSIERSYDITESRADVRAGLGYEPSKNFELELLFASDYLIYDEFTAFSWSAGDYEASPIYLVYLSGMLKFK